jgi:hypothetical protein
LQLFWHAPPAKTAKKVPGSYGYGETKRDIAILFLKFRTVSSILYKTNLNIQICFIRMKLKFIEAQQLDD